MLKTLGLIGTLASTIIGAGVFSLPFIFHSVGAGIGLLFLVFFFFVYVCIHIMYARLAQNNGGADFGELAKKYFPKMGNFFTLMIVAELLFVCTAYLALAPDFVSLLFPTPKIVSVIIFLFLGIVGVLLPMKLVEISETAGLVGIIILIGMVGWFGITTQNSIGWVNTEQSPTQFLLLFGPLLFALSGRPIISRIVRVTIKEKKNNIKIVMIWGTLIPAVLYLVYTFGILLVNPAVNENVMQTITLFPGILPTILACLGLIALWTSFFVIAGNARDILTFDFKINKYISFFCALFLPFAFYLFGADNFIRVIGFVGGVFLAGEGILITRMWQKARGGRNFLYYASWVFYLVFLLGVAYEVWKFA